MDGIYQSVFFRMSVYYLVGAITFPVVYAVTNQLMIHSVFTLNWLRTVCELYFILICVTVIGFILKQVIKNIILQIKNIGRKIPE